MDNNDVVAARRRALQEAIHSGETGYGLAHGSGSVAGRIG